MRTTQPSRDNGRNSLAAFARHLGINPATARQWKRRGKIWQSAEGYWAADCDGAERDTVTLESVTGRDTVTAERDSLRDIVSRLQAELRSVTATVTGRNENRDSVTPESVTERDEVSRLQAELASVTAERDRLAAELASYKMQVAGRAIRPDVSIDLCAWCDKPKGECDGHGIGAPDLHYVADADAVPEWAE